MIQKKNDNISISDMVMSEIHFTNYCFVKTSTNREYSISTLEVKDFINGIRDNIYNSYGLSKDRRIASKNAQEYLEDEELNILCFKVLLAVLHTLNKEYNVFKVITEILSEVFHYDEAKYISEYLKDAVLTIDLSINLNYELNNEHIILDTFNSSTENNTIDILILKAEHE